MCWHGDKPSPDQARERILVVDGRKPCDRLPTACDHDLGTLLDALEMLAQSIMKLPHPYLILLTL